MTEWTHCTGAQRAGPWGTSATVLLCDFGKVTPSLGLNFSIFKMKEGHTPRGPLQFCHLEPSSGPRLLPGFAQL